jgi:hypothetical protein
MNKQKKDKLHKKCRAAYQSNKSQLQIIPAVRGRRQSQDGPSALSQLESTRGVRGTLYNVCHLLVSYFIMQLDHLILDFYLGETARNKENVISGENQT